MSAKKKTVTVNVKVCFTGTVEVLVPESLPIARRVDLAERVALSQILATLDNPDAPTEAALEEYADAYALTDRQAEKEWNSVQTAGPVGRWIA